MAPEGRKEQRKCEDYRGAIAPNKADRYEN